MEYEPLILALWDPDTSANTYVGCELGPLVHRATHPIEVLEPTIVVGVVSGHILPKLGHRNGRYILLLSPRG